MMKLLQIGFAAGAATVLAGVAAANPYYDKDATTGELQKVCKDFSINSSDIISASCNKVTLGVVSVTSASITLERKPGSACGQEQSITPEAARVVLKFKCTITGDTVHERNLNDMMTWDATEGKLKWKPNVA